MGNFVGIDRRCGRGRRSEEMAVEGGAEPVQVEVDGGNEDRSEFVRPVLRREPSFSRWYDENGVEHVESPLGNSEESVEDGTFELPLLQTDSVEEEGGLYRPRQPLGPFRGRNVHMNGNGKSYVPFDIENSPVKELQVSENNNVDGSSKIGSGHHDQNGVTPGMVLKTLFFILMWYASSTCLTL